ncbi:glycosyltransferase [Algoriphagus kandeliae]|uniref:Glycosyltransferase n=1 Tax=Algoriphagus kandeliae TaxID=2562278 RepID=A0A4Y9QMW0_9BACT|nr:glycosyltransferase [Algoriphagus kandeliae]TFV93188.1 glycosyltransferase [Algoriphagus kandeliae]
MELIIYFIISFILVQFVLGICHILFVWKSFPFKKKSDSLPFVSVLVAARNEEFFLPKLLESFENLNYPSNKIEFLFADDQSEDATFSILSEWCQKQPNAMVYRVEEFDPTKNPKAQAIALIEKESQGEYLFFTDADCQVPPSWIEALLGGFSEKAGMVIGVTQVKGGNLLGKFQELDWWLTLSLVKVATDWRVPTTGLGNNMCISRKAYKASGGFENLTFSLTEDLELSKAVLRKGFLIQNQVCPEALTKTKAECSWRDLLIQRKRWMYGVMTLPIYMKALLALQFFYFPAIVYLLFLNLPMGLGIWFSKSTLQAFFLLMFARKAGKSPSFFTTLLFDFYLLPITLLTILYYFWPSATKWKSRSYS